MNEPTASRRLRPNESAVDRRVGRDGGHKRPRWHMRHGQSIVIALLAFSMILFDWCGNSSNASVCKPLSQRDGFIDNPFSFKILKNYSDDYDAIGMVVDSYSTCPLLKENIADASFCFLRTVVYDGLTVNVFSFDVIQGGTAEYILDNGAIRLRNGLAVGSRKEEVFAALGNPSLIRNDLHIWRSTNLHNYLVFTIQDGVVTKIRWHEEREPRYKNTTLWNTKYE